MGDMQEKDVAEEGSSHFCGEAGKGDGKRSKRESLRYKNERRKYKVEGDSIEIDKFSLIGLYKLSRARKRYFMIMGERLFHVFYTSCKVTRNRYSSHNTKGLGGCDMS